MKETKLSYVKEMIFKKKNKLSYRKEMMIKKENQLSYRTEMMIKKENNLSYRKEVIKIHSSTDCTAEQTSTHEADAPIFCLF